jgi:mRNA interferase MazF
MENVLTTKNKIVLIPFPFDDLKTTKVRPALCLTDPIGPYQHVVVAFISSRLPDDLQASDLIIDSNNSDFDMTGLRVTSVVRLHRLMTITISLIKRELGQISARIQRGLSKKMQRLFGLENSGFEGMIV